MLTKKNLILVCLSVFLVTSVSAQKTFKYIGATKCKMCHNKPTKGEQYNKWNENVHAHALESLSSQKSLDVAKKLGIADPTTDAKCLKCHSTYHMADAKLHGGIKDSEGVSCDPLQS
jgi:cytochrome c554/c'-like protein